MKRLIKVKKGKKKPAFNRQEYKKHKKLKRTWRKPKGRHSKLRKGRIARGKKPSTGFSSPKKLRGLNKQGLKEVLVHNTKDLSSVGENAAVIAGSVGKKKREEIVKAAKEKKIRIMNI